MSYTLTENPSHSVVRDSDGATITNLMLEEWQTYLRWRAEGNNPAPHVPEAAAETPPAEPVAAPENHPTKKSTSHAH